MDLQPTLDNELVQLRPLTPDDLEPLFNVAKDPLIWEQHPCPTRYERAEYEVFIEDSLQSKGALIVIDKATKNMIGSSRFKAIEGVPTAVEIGWSFLAREYWGGRYNRAVKELMIEHALQSLSDIIFYIGKDNIRSQKAVEKLGAKKLVDSSHSLIKPATEDLTYLIRSL